MSVAEAPPLDAAEDLEAEDLFETVDGIRVEIPPMSAYARLLANDLSQEIAAYCRPQQLGKAVVEVLFRLSNEPPRNRMPDMAFVSSGRWAAHQPIPLAGNTWDVVPDLAVEVVSPTDRIEELDDKLRDYFEAGVRLVWVVHPRRRYVQVFESFVRVRGLLETDELDGGTVLPGFKIPVAKLFPPSA
jgi:Uma2 family endonuclease